jgi:hypothetical protein
MTMLKHVTLVLTLLLTCYGAIKAVAITDVNFHSKALTYLEEYKDLAIQEMQRTGIPASIKLAQGMFESGFGQSVLAKQGNNHFGIKCKTEWTGETIYYSDDSLNECFRKYPSAYESYKDHSDFLLSRERYAFLFSLPAGDYMGWAEGLKKAGYATDPRYKEKIIDIIKTYELHAYDNICPKPVIYADKISITGKEEWTIVGLPERQVQELAGVVPTTGGSNGSLVKQPVTDDLKSIDAILTQSVKKRPKDMELKHLGGEPAVVVPVDQIHSGLSTAGKKSGKGGGVSPSTDTKSSNSHVGRQLNPSFNPNRHLVTDDANPKIDNSNTKTTKQPESAKQPANTVIYAVPVSGDKGENKIATNTKTTTASPIQQELPKKEVNSQSVSVANEKAIAKTTHSPSTQSVAKSNTPKTINYFQPDMENEELVLPKQKTYQKNGVKAVCYPYQVLPSQIAQTYGLKTNDVLIFNDLDENAPIPVKTNIFLQPKKDKAENSDKYHLVTQSQTLWQIGQLYGITLKALYLKNNLSKGTQPNAGDKILLRNSGIKLPKIKMK